MNIRVCSFFLIAGLLGAAQGSVTLDGIPPAAPGAIGRLTDYLQARPARSLGFSIPFCSLFFSCGTHPLYPDGCRQERLTMTMAKDSL